MKFKKIMLVTLALLAILAIGAVSASGDIDTNETLAVDDVGDEQIVASPVDDDSLEEADNLPPLGPDAERFIHFSNNTHITDGDDLIVTVGDADYMEDNNVSILFNGKLAVTKHLTADSDSVSFYAKDFEDCYDWPDYYIMAVEYFRGDGYMYLDTQDFYYEAISGVEAFYVNASDFNVWITDKALDVDDDGDEVVINFTSPQGALGDVDIFIGGQICCFIPVSSETSGKTINITLNDLGLSSYGNLPVTVRYYPSVSYGMDIATGALSVTKDYPVESFGVFHNVSVTSSDHTILSLSDVPAGGTLMVYVDDEPRYSKSINKAQDVELSASDLNITENAYCNIRAEFITDVTNDRIILSSLNTVVRVSSTPKPLKDLIDYMYEGSWAVKHKETHLVDSYVYTPDVDSGVVPHEGLPLNTYGMSIYGHGATIDGSGLTPIFALWWDYQISFHDITFINARAYYDAYGGGVITNTGNQGSFNFYNCTFINNTARSDGGAVLGHGLARDCKFINNSAGGNGGAIHGLDAQYCEFINNHADGDGGAMYGGDATRSNFHDNSAGGSAGAMCGGTADQVRFINNHADGNGGAFVGTEAQRSRFEDNSAYGDGGAVYNSNAVNTIFTNNVAKGSGGAMREGSASDCRFTANSAYSDDQEASEVNCKDCNFTVLTLNVQDNIKTGEYSEKPLYVNLTSEDGKAVKGINLTISLYKDGEFKQNLSCLSGSDWIINLSSGSYDAIFSFHNSNFKPVKVTLDILINSFINIDTLKVPYGNHTIAISLRTDAYNPIYGVNLTVEFKGNVTNYTTDGDGYVYVPTVGLVPGNYDIGIYFAGNDEYNSTEFKSQATIMKDNAKLSVNDMNATYGAKDYLTVNLTDSHGKPISGVNVTVELAGNVTNYTTNASGLIDVPTCDLPAGIYSANVTFEGSDIYTNATAEVRLIIQKPTRLVGADKNTTYNNATDYLVVGLTDANGTSLVRFVVFVELVELENNITLIAANYETNFDGLIRIATGDLNASVYSASFNYRGNETYAPSNLTVTLTVKKADSELNISDDVTFDWGESGSCSVSFEYATGVNASILNQSEAIVEVSNTTITVSGLGAGNYTLAVTTIPDKNHNQVTRTVNVTVNPVNSSVEINDMEFDYGSVDEIVVATEGAVGITAEIDGVNVTVSGNVISLPILDIGTYNLTVTTIPDGNHNPIARTVNVTVNPADSSVEINDMEFDYGSAVEIAVITEGATGITAEIDGVNVTVNGSMISLPILDIGTYNLTVTTIPDANHRAVNRTVKVTIGLVKSDIIISDIAVDYGTNTNIFVAVQGATGITAQVDGENITVIGNMIALPILDVGTHNLTVSTIPDGDHRKVTKTVNVTVNEVDSDAIIFDAEFDYGTVSEIIVLTNGATGIVAQIDGVNLTVSGNVISLPLLDAGTYSLTVATVPDKNHRAVNKTSKITVNKVDAEIFVSDITVDYGAEINVFVASEGVTAITAKINGENATVSDNSILIPVLDAGTYNLTVSAVPDENHNQVTETVTVTVNKLNTQLSAENITMIYNVNKDLVITLKDSHNGKVAGVEVTVDVNGKKTYTTDDNGQIIISTKGLAPKTYAASIVFAGNNNYNGASASSSVVINKATPKLTAKAKSFKRTVSTKKYTVTLKTNINTALKNVKVTIKINGKTYSAKTNSKGQATFKITKLTKKGKYLSLVKFAGNSYYKAVSKKITITVK